MHFYLCGWVGDGTDAAPFRPEVDTGQWSVIDLRPDPSVAAGACLVATTVRPASDPSGSVYLGDTTTGAMPTRIKKQIENRLGLAGITAEDLPRIVAELLIDHATTDGTRWRPLRPKSRGSNSWEIHLGGILWKVSRVAGGATYTETFPGNDGSLATGNRTDLTWTIVSGSAWQVTANQASPGGATHGDVAYARAEHDTAAADQYAEATVTTLSTTTDQFGPCARYAAAADTSYMAMLQGDSTVTLRKTVAGARTNLSSATAVTLALPQVLRTEIDGSTLSGWWDGVQVVSVTDTSITENLRAGLYSDEGSGEAVVDNFGFGDLSTAQTIPIGQAVETDAAGSVTGAKTGTVGQAVESDAGNTVVPSKTGSVGQALEANTAGAVVATKARLLGQALEVDTANPIAGATAGAQAIAIGQAVEADTALAITPAKTRSIGTATETDSSSSITATKVVILGRAAENDTAAQLVASKARIIGQALELDIAGSIFTVPPSAWPPTVGPPSPRRFATAGAPVTRGATAGAPRTTHGATAGGPS